MSAAARITPIAPVTTDNQAIPAGWEDIAAVLPPLATPEQVAELLQVELSTLQDWRYKGTGPKPTKIGKRPIRYRRHDILAWLANNQ